MDSATVYTDASILDESMFTSVTDDHTGSAVEKVTPIDAPSSEDDDDVNYDDDDVPEIQPKPTDDTSTEDIDSKGEPESKDKAAAVAAVPLWKQGGYRLAFCGILLLVGGIGLASWLTVRAVSNHAITNDDNTNSNNNNANNAGISEEDSSTTAITTNPPSLYPSALPSTLLPTTRPTLSMSPTASVTPTVTPSTTPTVSMVPTMDATTEPSASPGPTGTPTLSRSPTASPTTSIVPTTNVPKTFGFYVMGDIPYAPWEETMLQSQMLDLTLERQNHTYFTVHVGDMQKPDRTKCRATRYIAVGAMLRQGPLPTFCLPGDNDWIDCPDPTEALGYFRRQFTDFEQTWTDEELPEDVERMDVTYHDEYPEIFQFEQHGVLFLSVHLINSKAIDSSDSWDERMAVNIAWVEQFIVVDDFRDKYHAIVLFGHSLYSQDTREFFDAMAAMMVNTPRHATPVMYLHGDGHKWDLGVKIRDQLGWEHFVDVQVDQGGLADPILVQVVTDPESTILEEEHDLQYVLGRGMFRIDRRSGRYPDSVANNRD